MLHEIDISLLLEKVKMKLKWIYFEFTPIIVYFGFMADKI